MKASRAFVSRGNNIGVFRTNTDDNAMEYVHTMNALDRQGNALTPAKV